jgi:hypothetical protein
MKSKLNLELSIIEEVVRSQKNDNDDCLKAYYELINAGKKCSKLVDDENNLVRIFFHDLMRISTSYILKKNFINCSFRIPEWITKCNKSNFPYISYDDVTDGINLEEKIFNNTHHIVNIKFQLFEYLCDLLIKIFPNRRVVGIGIGIPIGYKAYFKLLIKFNVIFLQHNYLNIKCLDKQINVLNESLDSIIKSDGNNNNAENFKIIVNNHLRSNLKHDQSTKKYNFIITGASSEPINRVNSVLAKRDAIPVITFMHGTGDQTMYNEPRIGYCENSFADYLIGYGESGIDYENSGYVRGVTDPPKFIGCSSTTIREIYKTDKINKINKISDCQWMYVPDSGQLINQFGPYAGGINTLLYLKWQKQIVKNFPGVLYKKHPKGDFLFRSITDEKMVDLIGVNSEDVNIIADNFTDVYSKCDGFIFDTVSTAFMIAVATDKPIIYFNIEKRKFTELAKKKIKERCLWIDIIDGDTIDMDKIGEQLSTRNFVNNITSKYSLVQGSNKTYDDALFSLLETF